MMILRKKKKRKYRNSIIKENNKKTKMFLWAHSAGLYINFDDKW